MVIVTDGVCGMCGKSHTRRKVLVVPRHSELTPVFDRGDGINRRVTER